MDMNNQLVYKCVVSNMAFETSAPSEGIHLFTKNATVNSFVTSFVFCFSG